MTRRTRRATAPFALLLAAIATPAIAFCGLYVARGDADLFNEASKVVMVRDQDRTVITMVNDFQGEVTDFALVVPAPTVLEREQIHVTENAVVDHLDAFTAPRLVEYYDPDPCGPSVLEEALAFSNAPSAARGGIARARVDALGVTVEAEYLVGEYDIKILSAEQSDGLATWLSENGYGLPDGAATVLGSYIAQDMKFFVAKVNIEEHAKRGGGTLRPLQIAFESPKFMLPIRLGTANAQGSQDLLLYALTRTGRVETANYRTIPLPTNVEIPSHIKSRFDETYKAIFANTVAQEGGAAVVMEYAWDMGWCDPCAADPLTVQQLRELGVYWVQPGRSAFGGGQDVYVTRLHARYDAESFPEDLRLIATGNRENFQGRYVMRHAYTGKASCSAGEDYRRDLPARFEKEAQTLASLTGWDIAEIRADMTEAGLDVTEPPEPQPWWKTLWQD